MASSHARAATRGSPSTASNSHSFGHGAASSLTASMNAALSAFSPASLRASAQSVKSFGVRTVPSPARTSSITISLTLPP